MNSTFWKLIAVAAVVSVFYLGHGLHERTGVSLSDLKTSASAAEQTAVKNIEWEGLNFSFDRQNARREVPGGWLVTLHKQSNAVDLFGLTFVPDPDHKWKL